MSPITIESELGRNGGRIEVLLERSETAEETMRKIVEASKITNQAIHEITSSKIAGIFAQPRHQRLFSLVYHELSKAHKRHMVQRVKSCLLEPDPVKGAGMISGLLFELEMIWEIIQEGIEKFDAKLQGSMGAIKYQSYPKKKDRLDKNFTPDLLLPRPGGSLPHALEMKFSGSFTAGIKPVEQCAKYQAAVEQEKISGATIICDGLVNPNFKAWSDEPDPFPDVEMLYRVKLPSGHKYVLPFKPLARGRKGLNYQREEISFLKDHPDSSDIPYSMEQLHNMHPAWYRTLKSHHGNDHDIYIELRKIDKMLIEVLGKIGGDKDLLRKFISNPTWTTYADGFEDRGAPTRRVWYELIHEYFPDSRVLETLGLGLTLDRKSKDRK